MTGLTPDAKAGRMPSIRLRQRNTHKNFFMNLTPICIVRAYDAGTGAVCSAFFGISKNLNSFTISDIGSTNPYAGGCPAVRAARFSYGVHPFVIAVLGQTWYIYPGFMPDNSGLNG